MIKSKNILILQGGNNEEHEISLNTAKEVKKALVKLGHRPQLLNIVPNNFLKDIKKYKPDICFNALHGTFGEDGQIQKILYDLKIPFTHSGIKASKIAFDKEKTKAAIIKKKILIPISETINSIDINYKKILSYYKKFSSLVLKPSKSGSSYGVNFIKSKKDLLNIPNYEEHKRVIIEKYIEGKELTVTVLNIDNEVRAIEVTEIETNNDFFDYEAKYTKGLSRHIIPAKIPKNIYDLCLSNAEKVHKIIGCKGVTRSDFIYDEKKNKLYFIEINNQPGLTPVSLVPEQLLKKGINFIDLIDLLIKQAKCQK